MTAEEGRARLIAVYDELPEDSAEWPALTAAALGVPRAWLWTVARAYDRRDRASLRAALDAPMETP